MIPIEKATKEQLFLAIDKRLDAVKSITKAEALAICKLIGITQIRVKKTS